MDKIYIRDLALRCIIGIYDDERINKQDVIINVTLEADLEPAGKSDDFNQTVDYKEIKKKIVAHTEASSYQLIEALAENIANICLEHELVQKAVVSVDKPGALRFARSVAVELVREK